MSNRVWVQVADKERRVPIEGRRAYLEHDVKHNLRLTPFVQRRITEGDLVKVDPPAAETALAAPTTATPAAVAPSAATTPAAASATAASTAQAPSAAASEKGA